MPYSLSRIKGCPNSHGVLRSLAWACGLLLSSGYPTTMKADQTKVLFESPDAVLKWIIVNDSVMGGVSQSSIELTKAGSLIFEGTLSLENNGGFASARSRPSRLSTDQAEGFALRVRGDGRTYYFDLRSQNESAAGSYRAAFDTVKDEWTEIFLPAPAFERQSYGRVFPQYRLDPSTINSIGFTLSDKNPGAFRLEIAYVKSVIPAKDEEAEETEIPDPSNQARELISLAIRRGVPLFNDGNPEACAAIYEVTCEALVALPQISDSSRAKIKQALSEAEEVPTPARRAWILRYALDDALALLVG